MLEHLEVSINKEALRKEFDKLLAFYLGHDCDKCPEPKEERLPTKSYPVLFDLMKQLNKK